MGIANNQSATAGVNGGIAVAGNASAASADARMAVAANGSSAAVTGGGIPNCTSSATGVAFATGSQGACLSVRGTTY